MGQVNNESQPNAAPPPYYSSSSSPSPPPLTHFSHPHPLYPTPQASLCSACGLQTGAVTYSCTPCNFTLHQSCAKLPKRITHPAHVGCTLSLLTVPTYPSGMFSCDACSHRGHTWSYHCERCCFDLHITCSVKPLTIKHQAHPSCKLELMFKNPYPGSDQFSCDACKRIGSKQWLYRCNRCGFDVHMDCNTNHGGHHLMHSMSTGSVPNYQQPPPPPPHQPQLLVHSQSTGAINYHNQVHGQSQPAQPYPMMHNNVNPGVGGMMVNQPAVMNQPYYRPQVNQYQVPNNNFNNNNNNQGNNLMTTAIDGFVNGMFQGIGQGIVQGVMDGGGDGGGGGGVDGGDGGGDGGFDGSGGDACTY